MIIAAADVGDAESLSFPDASFDVIINIESSHCYGNMAAFVSKAARLLKPGGFLSWADMRGPASLKAPDRHFDMPSLQLIEERHLSDGVILALDQMNGRKLTRIRKVRLMGRHLSEFAGTKGSILYNGLKSGDVQYLFRRYRKTAQSAPAPDVR